MVRVKYIFIFFFAVFLCPENLVGQEVQKNISFDLTTYNFGNINARNGDLSCEFDFTNISAMPVYIKNISASCGCTVPEWTRDTIPSHGKGNVKVFLRINKLAGYFSKTIEVYTNLGTSPIVLQVTGRVLRNYKYDDPFQNKVGHLFANDTFFDFGKIEKGQHISRDVKFINDSQDTILLLVKKQPSKLKVEQTSKQLIPGGNSMITLTLDTDQKRRRIRKMKEIGFITIRLGRDTLEFILPIKIKHKYK